MTTMEKLFMQIFERKRWIIDQVKHQSHLFDQHLASTLLIDGIPPPPWLLPQPYSSDPAESKKEELISGLLFPFPQISAPYSSSRNSLNYQQIFAADSELRQGLYGDACAIHGKPEARGKTSVLPEVVGDYDCAVSGAPNPISSSLGKSPHECFLNDASELLPTPIAKSPQDQREAEVPDTYHSLEQSLARIQRSKPRQKDLELRNSVRACKSSLCDEFHADVNPSTITGSGNACPLTDHVDDVEVVKSFGTDCNVCAMEEPQMVDCRSDDKACGISSDRGIVTVVSDLQPLSVDESVKHGSSRSIAERFSAQGSESSFKSNSGALKVVQSICVTNAGDSRIKEKNRSIDCRRITRSQSSTQPHCQSEFLKQADSSAIGREARSLLEEAIHVNSTEKLSESSGMQEAEIEFCQSTEQFDNGGLSRMQESRDTGSVKVNYSEGGKSVQMQQIDANSGQADKPLNLSNLHPTVSRSTSTGSYKPTSVNVSTDAEQRDACSNHVHILSGNRDDAGLKSSGPDVAEMRVVSNKPSQDIRAHTQSNYNDDNVKNESEVLVSGSNADHATQVEPKQLDFDDIGGRKSGLKGIDGTALEERIREEEPAQGQSNSLGPENGDRECCSFSTEVLVEDTVDGSRITRPDTAVLLCDASEAGRSLTFDFSLEGEITEGRNSALGDLPYEYDGENALQHPLDVVEASSLSSPKFMVKLDLSAERSTKQFDSAEPSKLGSHDSKVEYSARVSPKISAEVKVGRLAGSTISSHPELILGDHTAEVHGSVPGSTGDSSLRDMTTDNPVCQLAQPVENHISGLLNAGCSKSDDHHISGNSVLSREKSSPHSGSLWPQSRQGSVGTGQAEPPTASPTSSLQSSRRHTQDRNLSRVECHQGDVPSLEEIITAHDGDAVCPNVSCNPGDLIEENLEDYAIEGFRFSPMQQEGKGDPGPSLDTGLLKKNAASRHSLSEKTEVTGASDYVFDIRTCIEDEVKVQQHAQDKFECGDAEQSASSEGPVEGKLSHLEESLEHSSHLVGSPLPPVELTNADQMMPVLEGFVMETEDGQLCLPKGGSSFEEFDLRDNMVERAGLMEQLCKSTCLHTPSSNLSPADKLHKGSISYQSVPNGLLEYIDLKSTRPLEDDVIGLFNGGFFKKEVGHALDEKSFSDCLPLSEAENARKPYLSPVGKFWEKIASNSGSSKNKASLIPELPCISEENEIADEATGTSANDIPLAGITSSAKRKPLADITEDPNCPASVSELENHRCSLESVNTEVSFSGTNKRFKQKLGTHRMSKKRYTNKMRDSKAVPRSARIAKVPTELRSSVSKPNMSLQKDGLGILGKEAKRGNIVCNVNSFVPLVQQKQAAAPLAGKRDVKVKALEAAEAARRQAEKREVERKMKKDALKLERARVEQENRRQLELQMKRKEEERKKKEAEIAARKRLREGEKKDKERKRKRVEDARRQQEEQKDKLGPKKEGKEMKAKAMIVDEKKDVNPKITENEAAITRISQDVLADRSHVPETPCNRSDNSKVTSFFNQGIDGTTVGDGIQEQSYEISPYQCSDNEDEDEDDDLPKKFIPSWASKNLIAQAISSQHRVDPDLILPPDSFCSIDEVVLPRKLRLK
ncbi:uncharacterized protein LOC116215406 isoform X1 [Punica granatum]|uniref:Uncharacterized protein LOC116215406 isoform X1 n=1 Tax=Punica granatum TaxID=22663 RepID=A0A6P8EP87_PUNGR|nr:uncharacterized protein LOC116215406 isoform X1 [Punica granatum]